MEIAKKPSLYSIVDRLGNLTALLEDESVPAEVLADALAGVEGELVDKGDAYIAMINNFKDRIERVKEEIARLQAYKKWLEGQDKRLKDGLLYCMDKIGRKDIISNLGKISWQNNPPALEVIDEKAVPAEYLTVIPEHIEVNHAALRKALAQDLKNGGEGVLMNGDAAVAMVTKSRRVVIR